MNTQAAVEVTHLRKIYAEVVAVDDVSLMRTPALQHKETP
jgi:hypothetical protein